MSSTVTTIVVANEQPFQGDARTSVTSGEEFSEYDLDELTSDSVIMNENDEPINDISEADAHKKFEFDLFDLKSLYMDEVVRIMDTIATYLNDLEPEDKYYIEKMGEFSNVLQARSGVISGNYYGGSDNDSSSGGGKSGGNGGEPHEGPPDSNTKSHSDSKGADSSNSSSSHDSSSMSGQHYNQHSLHREELGYDGDTSEPYHSDDNNDDVTPIVAKDQAQHLISNPENSLQKRTSFNSLFEMIENEDKNLSHNVLLTREELIASQERATDVWDQLPSAKYYTKVIGEKEDGVLTCGSVCSGNLPDVNGLRCFRVGGSGGGNGTSAIDGPAKEKEICTIVVQCLTPVDLPETIMRKESSANSVEHCSPTTMGEGQNFPAHRKLHKILYVDYEVQEKAAATVLEDARNPITNVVVCSFTVTADPLVGLECSEHTADYDAIVISSNNTNDDLNARDFLRVIRSSGCRIPIILLHDDSGQQLPSSVSSPSEDNGTSQLPYSSAPRKPFTIDDLSGAMAACFHCDTLAGSIEADSVDSAFSPLLDGTGTRGDSNKFDCFDAVEKVEPRQSIFGNEVTAAARQLNPGNRYPQSVFDETHNQKEKGILDVTGMLRQCASQQGRRDTFSSNDTSMPSWNGPMLLSTSGHGAYKLFPVDVEFSKNHPATQDEDVKRLTANNQLDFKTMTLDPPAWVPLVFASTGVNLSSSEGAFNKLEEQQTSACSMIEVWEEPKSRRLIRFEYDTSDSDKKLRQAMSANFIFITFPGSSSCYPDVEALRETIQQEVNALVGEIDVAEVWNEQCPTQPEICALHFSSKKIKFYDSIMKVADKLSLRPLPNYCSLKDYSTRSKPYGIHLLTEITAPNENIACGTCRVGDDRPGMTTSLSLKSLIERDEEQLPKGRERRKRWNSVDKEQKLIEAARTGRVDEIEALLDQGANIQCEDQYGLPAIFEAASFGHHATVALLLDSGEDIQAKDEILWTALHRAAKNGYHATVKLLLERGADIQAKDNFGFTALHEAASSGYDAVITILDLEEKGQRPTTQQNIACLPHKSPVHRHSLTVIATELRIYRDQPFVQPSSQSTLKPSQQQPTKLCTDWAIGLGLGLDL
eukprot:gene31343-40725_t